LTELGPAGNDHLLTLLSTKTEYAFGTKGGGLKAASTGNFTAIRQKS
jgi:hypothetical protein